MTTVMTRRLFTVGEYHRMGEAGILGEDDRVELIEGEIVEMTPIGARHAHSVSVLSNLLSQQLARRFIVNSQNPVRLSERSEPQPDLSVLRWRDDFYLQQLPTPADVVLVAEVGDSSVAFDRAIKLPIYARAGIGEVWIVDLPAGVIDVHLEPSAAGYGHIRIYRPGQVLSATVVDGIALDVSQVLG